MKLTILFLAFSLQVSAAAYAQDISLNFKNANLREVLQSIRKQSGYSFVVDGNDLKKANPVNITLKTSSIETTLHSLFENQPFIYKVEGKLIMIRLKEAEKKTEDAAKDDKTVDIKGTVTDEDGKPLSGATVILKGTQQGAVTNHQGQFSLADVPENGTLIVRMVGRESKEIVYKNGMLPSISLREVNADLKEVQIIAYGEVDKKFVTSNIGSVKGDKISQSPVTNVLYSLQGRVPGLLIQQASGISGTSVAVTVQGKNSIDKGNVPFYVIDGVPYTPNEIPSSVIGGSINLGPGSTLDFLNPADIESVEILKDADATAIYGSRAANGAILITTKKGKAGQTTVNLNMQTGWGKAPRRQEMMKTQQYIAFRKEAIANANLEPGPADYDVNGTWNQHKYTDWQKELIGGTAQYQNVQLTVSGGSENTQFLAGGGYIRETTVFPGDFSNVKGSAHFSINHASTNRKFQFELRGNYLQGKNRLPQTDLTDRAIQLAPNNPDLRNSDGSLNWGPLPGMPKSSTFDNPLAYLLQRYTAKTNNLISSGQLSYEILPNLVLKSTIGYNRLETDELGTAPQAARNPSFSVLRQATYSNKYIDSWIAEPQMTYSKDFAFGHIDALVGTTFQQTKNYLSAMRGRGFANDAQLENVKAAPTISILNYIQSEYRYSAFFGRMNYRYRDKYILNLTARRDGSSRFGSENLFNSFYSFGGAWLFSEENFFKKIMPVVDFGKIRATYGTTGNDQIGDYQFLNLYNTYGVDRPYQQIISLEPTGLNNPYLQWEETRKLNLGMDLGLFGSRMQLTVNYFRNRSSNQLLGYALPAVTGFGNITRNLPATVQNTGFEGMLSATPLKAGSFSWQTSINITISRNKLIKYEGLEQSTDVSRFIIGQPTNIIQIFDYAGVNPETGLYQFRTSKGELTPTPDATTDRSILIDPNPKFYGGFSNTLNYSGFSLDFLIQFVKQTSTSARLGSYPGLQITNQIVGVLDHWRTIGDQKDIQRISANYDDFAAPYEAALNSTAVYRDGSYARLKNASLSYSFPKGWLQRSGIDRARIFVQGQNLLTVTNYKGSDPETPGGNVLPPLKVYTIGFQLTL